MFRRSPIALLALFALAVAAPLAAGPPDRANNRKTVTVMTRNLYLGADVTPVIVAAATGTEEDVVAAVSEVWAVVQFTDFPARAAGLAGEIAAAQPDLIGLQEAELWQSQPIPGASDPDAQPVELDFPQILVDALAARGLHYGIVAKETGFSITLPGFTADGLAFLSLTEHEVILARTDLKTSELKLSNVQTGHFETNVEFEVPATGEVVTVQRGWASVDAKVRGKSFRFLTTHLEADSLDVRNAQAIETILGPANTALPVVLVADANSDANGESPEWDSAAYDAFLGAGFTDAWFQAHPGELVTTCCNAPDLTNPVFPDPSDDEGRIDLVLYRGAGDFHTLGATLLGADPSDRVSNGLALIWPSDHAGIAATLQIHN
ncbi:MAG: endonuclease/exonuclease/phosphatase family protein [Acidobacteriota bacterium]